MTSDDAGSRELAPSPADACGRRAPRARRIRSCAACGTPASCSRCSTSSACASRRTSRTWSCAARHPRCGIIKGCETVANSEYSRIAGVPVAVFGVVLSLTLMVLALAWWRTGRPGLLLAHYALSMVGVIFEMYFTYLELFVIDAVCVWCAAYAISLVARFLLSLVVWLRRDRVHDAGAG